MEISLEEVHPTENPQVKFTQYKDTGLVSVSDIDNSDFGFERHSDLTPGLNEGGLRIWECSRDLVSYLRSHPNLIANRRVLELGCGHGLPGIVCKQLGASEVVFQDYNSCVLQRVTMPNVIKNTGDLTRTKFVCGAWQDFSAMGKFEVIVTSETVYNTGNYPGLILAIKSCIEGVCIVACKSYYFGVGGGTELFVQAASSAGFSTRLLSHFEDGKSSIRDLIELSV